MLVGTVVEGQNQLFRLAFAQSLYGVGGGKCLIIFFGNQTIVLVDGYGNLAVMGFRGYVEHLAGTYKVHVVGAIQLHQLAIRQLGSILPRHVFAVKSPYTFVFRA